MTDPNLTPPESRPIKVRVPDGPRPRAEAANYFVFSHSGGVDVQMMLGYIDLFNVALMSKATAGGEVGEVLPEITHRFSMSIRSLLALKAQVDEILSLIRQSGDIEFPAEPPSK